MVQYQNVPFTRRIQTKRCTGPTTNPFSTYVTVRNEYEGIKSVIVQAEKNDKPLVQQTLIELHDRAQFQNWLIYPHGLEL